MDLKELPWRMSLMDSAVHADGGHGRFPCFAIRFYGIVVLTGRLRSHGKPVILRFVDQTGLILPNSCSAESQLPPCSHSCHTHPMRAVLALHQHCVAAYFNNLTWLKIGRAHV